MRFASAKVIACLMLLLSFAHAQQPPAAETQTENVTKPQTNDSPASVYVYRYKQFVGSALSPSVYCDENELARMDNGKFFVAKLSPGKHTFRSNDKQAGVEVELKSGQDYYIRVEIAAGMMKGHGRLVLVAPEQGAYEIKKLKPLDRDKVKDSERVTVASLEANK
jgi:Protein of unknown function (DUF2846)